MSENRHNENEPSSSTAPATQPPEIVPAVVSQAAQLPEIVQRPAVSATPPATVSPPTFDARLIRIIEKNNNQPEITAIQHPDIVQSRILEQK